jgi:hypothetical protein
MPVRDSDHPPRPVDPARELAETLASQLTGTLPPTAFRVTRDRGLRERWERRPGRITAMEVQDGALILRLAEAEGPGHPPLLEPWVIRDVHGVVISRRRAPLSRWLAQLERTLHGMTQETGQAEAAAHRLLVSLGAADPTDPLRVDRAAISAGLVTLVERLPDRLPDDVRATVARIADVLRKALPCADGGGNAETVTRIATDYLPTTLKVSLELSPDWTDPLGMAGGRHPLDLLREQLAVLEEAAQDAYQAALADDAAAVLANGSFLLDRFNAGDSPLNQVGVPLAPPPDPTPEPAAAPEPVAALPDAAQVAAVIRALDVDRDGYLARSELRALMAYLGEPMTDQSVRIFLALTDVDGDDRISEAELLRHLAPGAP